MIHVPKVPFRVFHKLKSEIKKLMIIFCFYLDMENEIQIIDNYSRVKIDFYFQFLILSFFMKMKHEIQFVFRFSFS